MRFETLAADAGLRLDQFLARRIGDASRARIQAWIKGGRVKLDGSPARASARLRGGEQVDVEPGPAAPLEDAFPEAIPLDILYEDEDLVAVSKPAGMTVHAGAGRREGTLVNALLGRFERLSKVGGEMRPGIVHRLDRLTSGVLLAAKTDAAHRELARQFAARTVRKTYVALVQGKFPAGPGRWTRLEMPIRRDRRHRVKMTARARQGRSALTEFRVIEQGSGRALLEVRISTGRTHQIRVHLSAIGHPVVGDALYGARAEPGLGRHFLHAREISFEHPSTGERLTIVAPLPPELEAFRSAIMGPKQSS